MNLVGEWMHGADSMTAESMQFNRQNWYQSVEEPLGEAPLKIDLHSSPLA